MRSVFSIVAVFLLFISPANAERDISFETAPQVGDALIAAIDDPADLSVFSTILGAEASARLSRAVLQQGFTAEDGESASFYSGDERYGEVHLIGRAGAKNRARDWEDFGGRAAGLAAVSKAARVSVLAPADGAKSVAETAFGAALGQYFFGKYKSDFTPVEGDLVIVSQDASAASGLFDGQYRHVAAAVNWARDLQSEPANALYPAEFVVRTRAMFNGVDNVSISVLNVRDMRRLGMGALIGVGQGSVRPPRLLITRYNGGAAGAAPLVFAGKGITFDTGGISLKGNKNMWQMKADMTGAASVTAAVLGLAKSRAPVNVIAVAALAENMPSGAAQRPGDVVRTMSGKTVEILSTDAEGRLVLADAVWYAQEQFNPALLVDVATLTGSVGRALSDEYGGLFTRSDTIAARVIRAGDIAGEDVWRLPLHANYDVQIESKIADIKNSDSGNPGAGAGAAFIGTFVKDETPWAHLDIAGVDWRDEPLPTTPPGASGFGVRLLDRLARDSAQ